MYQIVISRPAVKDIARLTPVVAGRVSAAIDALADDPRPAGCVKLAGSDQWRIRIGDWRVIYTIADDVLVVEIVTVGSRGGVYKGRGRKRR